MTLASVPDPQIRKIADMTYEELDLLPGGTSVDGAVLVKKHELLGVPFIATSAYFHIVPEEAIKLGQFGFVTIRITIAGEVALQAAIRNKRIRNGEGDDQRTVESIDELGFSPNERLCFNDGSTGVRREIVKLLALKGLIAIPGHPGEGAIYDQPWMAWDNIREMVPSSHDINVPHFTEFEDGAPFLLRAKRGLRDSEYDYLPGQSAVTYYFG